MTTLAQPPTTVAQQTVLLSSLMDLIKHADEQLMQVAHYHYTALGSLIAILAILVGLTANWVAYGSIALLTAALAVNWATTTTKLSLQKLCWVRLARELEAVVFVDGLGPFTAQQQFFDTLDKQGVSNHDRLLLDQIGSPRLKLIPVLLLTAAIAITGLVVVTGVGKVASNLATQPIAGARSPTGTASGTDAPADNQPR